MCSKMRFLHTSTMAGRLHLLDIGDMSPWQLEPIRYDDDYVDYLDGRLIFQKPKRRKS